MLARLIVAPIPWPKKSMNPTHTSPIVVFGVCPVDNKLLAAFLTVTFNSISNTHPKFLLTRGIDFMIRLFP